MQIGTIRLRERAVWKAALCAAPVLLLGMAWLMTRKISFNKAEIVSDARRTLTQNSDSFSMVFTGPSTLTTGGWGHYTQWDVIHKKVLSDTEVRPINSTCNIRLNADGQSFWLFDSDAKEVSFYDGDLKAVKKARLIAIPAKEFKEGLPSFALAFDHNTRLMLNTGDYGHANISIWDTHTGQKKTVLKIPLQRLTFYNNWAASPDGKIIALSIPSSGVNLYNANTGALIRTLQSPTESIRVLRFSPDRRQLASGSVHTFSGRVQGSLVHLWDIQTGLTLAAFNTSFQEPTTLEFSHTGSMLAVGYHHGELNIWDTFTQQSLLNIHAHKSEISSLAFTPNDTLLATGSDSTIKLWPLK